MKKLLSNLNFVAIVLMLVGFSLRQTFGKGNVWGMVILTLGIVCFAVYLFLNRSRFKDKNSRLNFIFASNILVIVILVIAIVAAFNYLGTKIHKRFDFTVGKVHSISDQSIQVVKNL